MATEQPTFRPFRRFVTPPTREEFFSDNPDATERDFHATVENVRDVEAQNRAFEADERD